MITFDTYYLMITSCTVNFERTLTCNGLSLHWDIECVVNLQNYQLIFALCSPFLFRQQAFF